MSKSVYASRAKGLEQDLARSIQNTNEALAAKAALEREAHGLTQDLHDARVQRDEARKSVASLKEMLLNAQLSAARVQGQLDRVERIEASASVPFETRTVTGPHRDAAVARQFRNPVEMGDATIDIFRSRRDEKHWTGL